MSNIKPISLIGFKALLLQAQEEHSQLNEPIPEMSSESESKIEYILQIPFQRVFGKIVYWSFYKKAAIQFYLLVKNHPLANGNKRMACYCLMFFYKKNGRQFTLSNDELYKLAYFAVNSDSNNHEETVNKIAKYLKSH